MYKSSEDSEYALTCSWYFHSSNNVVVLDIECIWFMTFVGTNLPKSCYMTSHLSGYLASPSHAAGLIRFTGKIIAHMIRR